MPHLHSLPERPDWTPYRTSYYTRAWGFCLAERQLDAARGRHIRGRDRQHARAGLADLRRVLPAAESRDEEVLLTHSRLPPVARATTTSSGIAALTELGARLAARQRRLSYRLLFVPGTIGSITWLARNEEHLAQVVGGLVLACIGDPAPLTYKRSRRGDALVDRAAMHVSTIAEKAARILDFVPWGWDERQFNSPGFDLPVGCLSRSREDEYHEYHSSADDLSPVLQENSRKR